MEWESKACTRYEALPQLAPGEVKRRRREQRGGNCPAAGSGLGRCASIPCSRRGAKIKMSRQPHVVGSLGSLVLVMCELERCFIAVWLCHDLIHTAWGVFW